MAARAGRLPSIAHKMRGNGTEGAASAMSGWECWVGMAQLGESALDSRMSHAWALRASAVRRCALRKFTESARRGGGREPRAGVGCDLLDRPQAAEAATGLERPLRRW